MIPGTGDACSPYHADVALTRGQAVGAFPGAVPDTVLGGVCRLCRHSGGFSSWLTFRGEPLLLGLQGGRYLIKSDDRLQGL